MLAFQSLNESEQSVVTTRKYDLLQPHFTIILVKSVEYETEYKIGNLCSAGKASMGRLKDNTAKACKSTQKRLQKLL